MAAAIGSRGGSSRRASGAAEPRRGEAAIISLRVNTLAQLFDSLDPAPFPERGLDRNAEAYIVDCAADHPPHQALRVLIHAPVLARPHVSDTTRAIHGHFRYLAEQAERRHRRRMRYGRVALAIGMAVMLASLALRAMLGDWIATPVGQGVGEGLLILGWVVLWRPTEMLLFERWESRQERHLLDRLAHVPIDFEFVADEPILDVAR